MSLSPRPLALNTLLPALFRLVRDLGVMSRPNLDPTQDPRVVPVYDEVPENAPAPYIVLGAPMETPADDHTTYGFEVVTSLHVWSRYRGFSELGIISAQLAELDHQDAAMAAELGPPWEQVSIRLRQARMLRDPDQSEWRQSIIDIIVRASSPIPEEE